MIVYFFKDKYASFDSYRVGNFWVKLNSQERYTIQEICSERGLLPIEFLQVTLEDAFSNEVTRQIHLLEEEKI